MSIGGDIYEGAGRRIRTPMGLGEVVSALTAAGLMLVRLIEHPEHFCPQFPHVSASELRRLPHTFSLLMRKPGES